MTAWHMVLPCSILPEALSGSKIGKVTIVAHHVHLTQSTEDMIPLDTMTSGRGCMVYAPRQIDFAAFVQHAGCLHAQGCSFKTPKGQHRQPPEVIGWSGLKRQDVCRLDFENEGSDYFHRLRQLAHAGLILIAQGSGSCLQTSRSSPAQEPLCKAGIWALIPQIGVCHVPFLTVSEVGLNRHHHDPPLGMPDTISDVLMLRNHASMLLDVGRSHKQKAWTLM